LFLLAILICVQWHLRLRVCFGGNGDAVVWQLQHGFGAGQDRADGRHLRTKSGGYGYGLHSTDARENCRLCWQQDLHAFLVDKRISRTDSKYGQYCRPDGEMQTGIDTLPYHRRRALRWMLPCQPCQSRPSTQRN